MPTGYSRILFVQCLLCILILAGHEALSQRYSLCSDRYFLPGKRSLDPLDSACMVIENGAMYKMTEQIVKLSGLPMNFVVCRISHVQNAFATLDKYGNRFIKYDDAFMRRLNRDSTALESMIILAHEIGHHIFFHTAQSGAEDLASSYMRYAVQGSPFTESWIRTMPGTATRRIRRSASGSRP